MLPANTAEMAAKREKKKQGVTYIGSAFGEPKKPEERRGEKGREEGALFPIFFDPPTEVWRNKKYTKGSSSLALFALILINPFVRSHPANSANITERSRSFYFVQLYLSGVEVSCTGTTFQLPVT